MRYSTRVLETDALDVASLDGEHSEIRCRYAGLEKAILHGLGQPAMLDAASRLVQTMLLHFTHEEQFHGKLGLSPRIQERHRNANIEVTVQLFEIEAGLEQRKSASIFQLLLLGRIWMKEHMHQESDGFECEPLLEGTGAFLVCGDHLPTKAGETEQSRQLRPAHLGAQGARHATPALNG